MRRLASEFPSDVERGRVDVHLEEMNSSSISLGSTSIEDFCTWISDRADVAIKNSRITDISWWEEKAGLKHQLVLLRFEHTEASGDVRVYYVKLERAGRTTCNERAIDKATISERAESSNSRFLDGHMLFFALLRQKDSEFLPEGIKPISAFKDFLDHKWRGPPATLKDLARYLRVIVAREPNYTLWSSNCFWFSRHVIHIIGLRHYSFPFIAFTMDTDKFALPRTADNNNYGTTQIAKREWKAHDPSSIGLLFRFLHYEEWRNGILMFRRLIIIVSVLLSCAITAGSGYGFSILFLVSNKPPAAAGYAAFLAVCGILPLCSIIARPTIRGSVGSLTRWRIRGTTASLVRVIERDDPPDGVRGDLIPPKIPLYKEPVGYTRMSGNNVRTYTMRVVPEPRKLPTPWERDAQIYAPAKKAYYKALEKMRDLEPTVSKRDLLLCTPQVILEKKWCRELVKMIYTTEDLGVRLYLMGLLLDVCETERGALDAVKAGAIGWMKLWSGYESRGYTPIRLVACRIIEVMARHESTIRKLVDEDICTHLVAVIRTSPDVLCTVALIALARIVPFPHGAQAAIDAGILGAMDFLLRSERDPINAAACQILEHLVWLEPADEDVCKLLLRLLKQGNSNVQIAVLRARTVKIAVLRAMYSITSLEDGAVMLIAAGALEVDWMVLLKSSDDTVRGYAPLVLLQLVGHDHTDSWKQTTKYCAQLVALIRDDNTDVSGYVISALWFMYNHPEWIDVLRDAGAMQAVSELVSSSDRSIRLSAGRLRDLLAANGQTYGLGRTGKLWECDPAMILQQNRCRELVEMIQEMDDLELKIQYLRILYLVCGQVYGAEAAIAGGTLLLMKSYLSSSTSSIKIKIWACDILEEIAEHVDTVVSINVLPQLVAFITDSSADPELVEHAIDALYRISSSKNGAKAAIAADALLYIGHRLKTPNTADIKTSACCVLERLATIQPAPPYACELVVELWRNDDILPDSFGAAHSIASFASPADALVEAGALEELNRLLESSDDAVRRAAPVVLSQILAHHSEKKDSSRSAERFCPQFLSLIRDTDDRVVEASLFAIVKMAQFPAWKTALQDAGAPAIFSQLRFAQSQNEGIQYHASKILKKLHASEEEEDARTESVPPSHASSSRQLIV